MIFTNLIQTNLRTKIFGKEIEYYQRLGSTNKEAWELIENGEATHGMIIITDHQFKGKGRSGNSWFMSPSKGIAMSLILLESLSFKIARLIPLVAGIAMAKTLNNRGFSPKLKWPNDIFFGSKKLIGFLPRVITRGKEIIYVRVGLGMNVLNYTPSEGISLSKVLQTKNINQHYWTAKVLKAFYDAIECNKKKEYVIKSANKFLTKSFLPSGYCPHTWKIKDIDSNGHLRIENETQLKVIRRF